MATREELYDALRNADKAGDTEGAAKLATYIQGLPAETAAQKPQQPVSRPSLLATIGRQAGLAGRAVSQGVASLPLMAMDAGVAGRNLASNLSRGIMPTLADFNPLAKTGGSPQQYELPSATFNRSLTQVGVPEPKTGAEKIAGFVESALTGSRMPAPQAANQAPANFRGVVTPKEATLEAAQSRGYVVPPSTTNPTPANQIMESVGGKIATAQDAAVRNQGITNQLARAAVGLQEDSQITPQALQEVRNAAGKAYAAIRDTGEVAADPKFSADLAESVAKFTKAGAKFKTLAQPEVTAMAEDFNQPAFDANDAMDAISLLRDKAGAAYQAGNKTLGSSYKGMAKAFEDVIERNLEKQGGDSSELLKNFRDARTLIAKTHTVEDALNTSTGNVSAAKLGTAVEAGKPLTGELRTAGKFGAAFPKAAREVTDSGSVRNTDVILGGGSALMAHEPTFLLYPFARMGMRRLLLSQIGQKGAVPNVAGAPRNASVMAALAAAKQSSGQ